MNLINKKLITQRVLSFQFPDGEKMEAIKKLVDGWQKALKDSDLEKTKEKSVQGKFLNTFFENILGYSDVTTGQEEYTLIQHPRIEDDSKEPDGSLGWFTKDHKETRVVIELKDAKTSLDKKQASRAGKLTPVEQAYLYSTKYDGCNWIIVSNFKEIRLYHKNKTQEYFEKFNILELHEDQEFKRFYFTLCKENLIAKNISSTIDVLADSTSEAEQDITKKFYKEYREIRLKLIDHIVGNHPEINKEVVLEKAQKLLDRFIFTLFCEDSSSLLPLNIVKETYDRALNSFSPSDERVWNEFKGLFQAIDKGNARVRPPINAYNGGLFAKDDVLDGLSIKDDFWADLMSLTTYDFETDLNVNILGHIFEQSISDLENLKSELSGGVQEQKKSKRKKDGIFYTPEYITRFIVEQTVGRFIEENPDSLETIKILDPACGSGAFPNQAHSYLLAEHKARFEAKINEKLKRGDALTLFDYNPVETNKGILLNNIFGVDLNQESVEITKLALWLKTASKSEKLQNLDKNIKCGNSLISDPEIAGKRAFNWNESFKEVLDEGGFDVIIGNPPYGADIDALYDWFEKNYPSTSQGHKDTYKFFVDKAMSLLKKDGYLGYIIPNTFLFQPKYKDLKELIEKYEYFVINLGDKIFEDAEVPVCILIIKNTKQTNTPLFVDLSYLKDPDDFSIKLIGLDFEKERSNQKNYLSLFAKSKKTLDDVFELKDAGIQYHRSNIGLQNKGGNDLYERAFQNINDRKFVNYKKTFYGSLIDRYFKASDTEEEFNLDYRDILNDNEQVSFFRDAFSKDKIIWRQTSADIKAMISLEEMWFRNTIQCAFLKAEYVGKVDLHFALGVFNSSLYKFYYRYKVREQGRVFPQVKLTYLRPIPFVIPSKETQEAIKVKVEEMLTTTSAYKEEIARVSNFLLGEYGVKENKTIQSMATLGWNEFVEMLSKQRVKLSVEKKEELFNWFKNKKSQLANMKSRLDVLDNEIDKKVYSAFSISNEEQKLVEEFLI